MRRVDEMLPIHEASTECSPTPAPTWDALISLNFESLISLWERRKPYPKAFSCSIHLFVSASRIRFHIFVGQIRLVRNPFIGYIITKGSPFSFRPLFLPSERFRRRRSANVFASSGWQAKRSKFVLILVILLIMCRARDARFHSCVFEIFHFSSFAIGWRRWFGNNNGAYTM